MTKEQIIQDSETAFKEFGDTCVTIPEERMFTRAGDKWSVAENIQHLVISTNMTSLAYSLPRFLVRWIGGTPNRRSRTFTELKDKYDKRLSEGGKASGRYIPKPVKIKYGKERLLHNWDSVTAKYIRALDSKRTEADLDNYLARHPLLGRITLRELCYFTIFHTRHHLDNIQKTYPAQ
jgi:hypothetical protein